jgi:methionyl-tRNA formyltransferase
MTLCRTQVYKARVRSVFFGTPAIAVPALLALHEVSELVGVVCQPDRPQGRGLHVAACAVKQAAELLKLEVYQPEKVRDGKLAAWLSARAADVALVLAYGRILPKEVLTAPVHGCVNLHASLLPRYRGAAPIQWSLMNGESETGISLMRMEEGLDTGPVFAQRRCPIPPNMNAGQLTEQLAELAAEAVRGDLRLVTSGHSPQPQDDTLATHAPPIEPEHGRIDWTRPALALHNQVRALSPRPGAFTELKGKRLRLLETRVGVGTLANAVLPAAPVVPGEVVLAQGELVLVSTGDGWLRIEQAQLEGKRALGARDLVNGRAIEKGTRLGTLG